MTLIDSHCHIDDEQFDHDRDQAVERAQSAGVESMVVIGTGSGPPDLEAGIRMAERYAAVWATAGVHPQYAAKADDGLLRRLDGLLAHPKVLAVGEIGLDYHWDTSAVERQKEVFIGQMEIARAAGKPIVIHTRDAWDDTLALIEKHWPAGSPPCIMHCFTGDPAQAGQALALGCFLSFGGIVTYPKARELHASAKLVPSGRLLVETDAPYLAPVPHRGKRNEPAFVVHTLNRLAALRGQPPEELADATTANFGRAFLHDSLSGR